MIVKRRWGERVVPTLAPGERLVWRGAPAWRSVARHVYHVPLIAGYFVVLTLVDMAITRFHEGAGWPAVYAAIPTVISGVGCVMILLTLSWAVERTTNYLLTTERIVMQFGIALPATLSIPLQRIVASSVRVRGDHTGDIALRLGALGNLSMAKLWPHVRPWGFWAPEPMLRDIRRAGEIAPLLCRMLAATHAEWAATEEREMPEWAEKTRPEPQEEEPARLPTFAGKLAL